FAAHSTHDPAPDPYVGCATSNLARSSCGSVAPWCASLPNLRIHRAVAAFSGFATNHPCLTLPSRRLARSESRLPRLAHSCGLRTGLAVRSMARGRTRLLLLDVAALLVDGSSTLAVSLGLFAMGGDPLPAQRRYCEYSPFRVLCFQRPPSLSFICRRSPRPAV